MPRQIDAGDVLTGNQLHKSGPEKVVSAYVSADRWHSDASPMHSFAEHRLATPATWHPLLLRHASSSGESITVRRQSKNNGPVNTVRTSIGALTGNQLHKSSGAGPEKVVSAYVCLRPPGSPGIRLILVRAY